MRTIGEVIAHGETCLREAGISPARVDIEWLVESVTGIGRLELPLFRDRLLSADEESELLRLIGRRERRVPLQHLLGNVPFLGHEILVTPDALIPRPETERLAEIGIKWLLKNEGRSEFSVLDFGTGTGCLSIAVAQAVPRARVVALDLSKDALALARRNVEAHGLNDRIHLLESDGFERLPEGSAFDLILSNPPYIPADDIATLQEEVRAFDPRLALDGGEDGLDFYRLIASEGGRYLRDGGWVLMEHGDGQERALEAIFGEAKWRNPTGYRDDNDVRRILSVEC